MSSTVPLVLPALTGYRPERQPLTDPGVENELARALQAAGERSCQITHLASTGRRDLAAMHLADLEAACADFLAQHPRRPAGFDDALTVAATPLTEAEPPHSLRRGRAVQMENGLTGTISHTYAFKGQRMAGIHVTFFDLTGTETRVFSAPLDRLRAIHRGSLVQHPAS